MSFDRRSFRLGILAGAFLFLGLIAGIVLSSRLDWLPAAEKPGKRHACIHSAGHGAQLRGGGQGGDAGGG